ncbi:MAG: ATPase, T2SS/T4P/T4SS family, partial [Oscillospiraceae bacterium]
LSTLHTNDAVSSVVRLMDMGVENYLIANSVIGLVAQRLMKKVCPACGKEVETTPSERAFMGFDIPKVKKAVGCPACNDTGYAGRIAIHEIAAVDKGMRELINRGASVAEIADYAIQKQGMKTLKQAAVSLVAEGVTTMEELIKVAYHTV